MSARAAPAIFVGYDEERKAYLVLPEGGQQPISRRDILFDEDVFPWKQKEKKENDDLMLIPKYDNHYGNDSESEEVEEDPVEDSGLQNRSVVPSVPAAGSAPAETNGVCCR